MLFVSKVDIYFPPASPFPSFIIIIHLQKYENKNGSSFFVKIKTSDIGRVGVYTDREGTSTDKIENGKTIEFLLNMILKM